MRRQELLCWLVLCLLATACSDGGETASTASSEGPARMDVRYTFAPSDGSGADAESAVDTTVNPGQDVANEKPDTELTSDLVEDAPDSGSEGTDACSPNCTGKACGSDGCGGYCGGCPTGESCNDTTGTCETVCDVNCVGKTCGDDGCGGSCGSCLVGESCIDNNCQGPCVTDCVGKSCGADGCGGTCGTCPGSTVCEEGTCVEPCTPSCDNKSCGPDGCGGTCGNCSGIEVCDDGTCVVPCVPACIGKTCGDDGCGGVCGVCSESESCLNGLCQLVCQPNCAGLECGDDGCGGLCGSCASGESCITGLCFAGCTPLCTGKECGSDGCGGSCGQCDLGEFCTAGTCVTECSPICGANQCGPDGCGGTCGTCAFGESCVGGLCVSGCSPNCAGKECGSDGCGATCGVCSATEFCLNSVCVANCTPDCTGKSCGDDGCGGSCGSCFTSEVCNGGVCEPSGPLLLGDTCELPFVVGLLPYTASGTTTGYTPNYETELNTCPGEPGAYGGAAADVVYEFTPTTSGEYSISLTPQNYDSFLYVVTDCSAIGSSCVGGDDIVCSSNCAENVTASLTANTSYFIIVDSWSTATNMTGEYTLTVTGPDDECAPSCTGKECGPDGCGGVCGICTAGQACTAGLCFAESGNGNGDTCVFPKIVTGVPYTDTGSTSGYLPDYATTSGACPGMSPAYGATSSDVVYQFTPLTTGSYSIVLSAADFDSVVYVVEDCEDIANTCIGGDDAICSVGCTEIVDATLYAGTSYYIIVDAWSNSSNITGNYALTITLDSTGPVDCGGSCGPGEICIGGACVGSQGTGDTCSDPFQVDTVPFTGSGDTSGSQANYAYDTGVCPGVSSGYGSGSNDDVWEFTAPATGSYTVSLNATFDSTLYVVGDCGDIAGSCLGAVDEWCFSGCLETLDVTLSAGQTVYVVVDGYSNTTNYYGTYTLSVTGP